MIKRSFGILLSIFILTSCNTKHYSVTSTTGKYIPVTQTAHPDTEVQNFVNHYKTQLDKEMNQIIGYSTISMMYGKPESLLTNFTSDAMLDLDKKYTHNFPVDITLMNVHGHRSAMPQGDITLGNIYSIYSFDNMLVLIRLKGKYVNEIFDAYARMEGAGISNNVRLKIKDKKLLDATVNGQPVDPEKVYTIVTLDYLAEGNNGMEALKKAELSEETGLTLRDYMIDYVKNKTAKGEKLTSKLDGRITVVE